MNVRPRPVFVPPNRLVLPEGEIEVREVPGTNGKYLAAVDGRIFTLGQRPGFRNPWPHPRTGHLLIKVYQGSRWHNRKVHRMVCEAWHGPAPDPSMLVLHLDDNPQNNCPSNLAWGTKSQNEIMKHNPGVVLSVILAERAELLRAAGVGEDLDELDDYDPTEEYGF